MSSTNEKAGISRPKPIDGDLKHPRKKPFQVSFWVVAESKPKVELLVNGESYSVEQIERKDIDAQYPKMAFRSGFSTLIP